MRISSFHHTKSELLIRMFAFNILSLHLPIKGSIRFKRKEKEEIIILLENTLNILLKLSSFPLLKVLIKLF